MRLDLEKRARRARIDKILRRADTLTQREREVMRHMVAGQSTRRIVAELGISIKTVEIHRSNIMAKMQAQGVAHLVSMWLRAGHTDADNADWEA